MSVVIRVCAVLAFMALSALALVAPWHDDARAPAGVADGTVGFSQDFGATAPHELVSYEMPPAADTPPLGEGVAPLDWTDLWADGAYPGPQAAGAARGLAPGQAPTARLGTPTADEFPAGTSRQDMELFFLDLEDMRAMQPMVGAVKGELDGRRVRIAGYTTPVGFGEDDTDFLLVPELGACIHVPPPPPNQIVYVGQAAGEPTMFAPVWVTGTLRAEPLATVLADVGYRLEDARVEPYR